MAGAAYGAMKLQFANARRSILPRIHVTSGKWLDWLPAKPLLFYRALWLGLLDTEGLIEATRLSYLGQSGFVDENWNIDRGLMAWEDAMVKEYFIAGSRVLVAGAGGGREVIALLRQGFEVTACDFSTDLTEACRRNVALAGLHAEVVEMQPNALPAYMGHFDGIVVGRGFYHHVPTRERRVAFLADCRVHLAVGSPLFVSDFHVRPVHSSRHRRIARLANWVRRWRGNPSPVELGDWLAVGFQHAFTEAEIRAELHVAGFETVGFQLSPLSPETNLAHAMARARTLEPRGEAKD